MKRGYAVLTPDGDGSAPVAAALFRLETEGVLSSEAAIGAAPTLRRGRVFVDQRNTLTGLALANPDQEGQDLDLSLRDAGGHLMGVTRITLPAGAQTAQFVSELFSGIADDFVGSLTFEAEAGSSGVAAVTIRQSVGGRGQPLFATLPVIDLDRAVKPFSAGEAAIVFPHIGAGGPLTTQIVLINPTSQPIGGTIALTASDGSALQVEAAGGGSRLPFQLPENGVESFTLTNAEGIVQGYALVTVESGDELPGGTAIFQFRDPAGNPISEAGVGASRGTRRARIFVDLADTQTGMAVAAPGGSQPVELTFSLSTRTGDLIARATRTVPAAGHLAFFADELFPALPDSFTGTLQLESPQAVAPITLKLTSNSLGDPILTTLPVANLEDLPQASGPLVLPQIGSGLGISTRLLLLAGETGQAGAGEIDFYDSQARPLEFFSAGLTGSQFRYRVEPRGSRQFRLDDTATPSSIFLDPFDPAVSEIVVNLGDRLTLSPTVIDSEGKARDDFTFSFLSLDPAVAMVDEHGGVEPLEAGFSTVTVESQGVLAAGTLTVVSAQPGPAGFNVEGVAQDLASRLYLVSPSDHTVLLSNQPGVTPQVYAGVKGQAGLRNGLRDESLFRGPVFAAVNQASGELLVSDKANHVIRAVRPGSAGSVATFAGTGEAGHRDGPRLEALFRQPEGVAVDQAGGVWVADSGNHVIRRIRLTDGIVETVAGGAGLAGFADGTGAAARFNSPTGLAFEAEPLGDQLARQIQGLPPPPLSILVADTGNGLIRRVFEDGRVQTLSAPAAVSTEAERFDEAPTPPRGDAGPVRFEQPVGVAADPFGRVYVTEPSTDRASVLLPNGDRVPLAQRGSLTNPTGLAITRGGEVVVTVSDQLSQTICYGPPEVFDLTNEASGANRTRVTVTGRNFAPDTQPVVPGAVIEDIQVHDSSTFSFLSSRPGDRSLTTFGVVNRAGIDQSQVALRADGSIGTTFGLVSWTTRDIALDPRGNLTILNASGLHQSVSGSEAQVLIAGSQPLGAIDRVTRLQNAYGVDVDAAGRIYLADAGRARILRIDPASATAAVVAGDGETGFSGEGGPALLASLNRPQDVQLDSRGNLYVVDTGNHRIRRIEANTGFIFTVAGNGDAEFSGDGGDALDAGLNAPGGLAVDAEGNLLVADTGNHRIRRIDAQTGRIQTIAGDGTPDNHGDGGPASEAGLEAPLGVALDFDGNLYIGTVGRVRRVDASTGVIETVVELSLLGYGTRIILDAAQNLYIVEVGDFGRLFKLNSVTGSLDEIPFDPRNSS